MSTPLSASVPDAPLVDETAEEGTGKGIVAGLDERAGKVRRRVSSRPASIIAIVLAVLWTIPTFGLLVTSFRPPREIRRSGWWEAFANPEFTIDNYTDALFGGSTSFATYFINSLVITPPATRA